MDARQPMSDAELFALMRDGDADGTRSFCNRFGRPLVDFFYKHGHSREDSEEFAQDVLHKVISHRQSIDLTREPVAYLWMVARNHHLDAVRSRRARIDVEPVSDDTDYSRNGSQWRGVVSEYTRHVSSGVSVERELEADDVRFMLNLFGEPDRSILLLRTEGFQFWEIAVALGMSLGAVKMRIQRIRTAAEAGTGPLAQYAPKVAREEQPGIMPSPG